MIRTKTAKSALIFENRARNIHGDKYDYSKVKYITANDKVCIICPEHGIFWQSPAVHINGKHGCPKCNSSKLENSVRNFLIENNFNFEEQKTFEWLKYKGNQYLDFYLPDYNIAIECQGIQHFKPVDFANKGDKWAIKEEQYVKDISEAFPEEVVEAAKESVKEREAAMLDYNIKPDYDEVPEEVKPTEDILTELAEEQETKRDLDEIKNVINQIYGAIDEPEGYKHLDILLSKSLQAFTQEQCIDYDVPYELVLALMESESSFREDIGSEKVLGGEEGGPRYYGYMQLSADNCTKAENTYALNPHTPEGNIEMAVLMLSGYLEKYNNDWENAIMAYKGGEGYADSMIIAGKTSDAAINVTNRACHYGVLLGTREE